MVKIVRVVQKWLRITRFSGLKKLFLKKSYLA